MRGDSQVMRPLLKALPLLCAGAAVWGAVGLPAGGAAQSVSPPASLTSKALASVSGRLVARNVTRTPDQNEYNPRFTPDGLRLSFERRSGSAQALVVVSVEAPGAPPERVSTMPRRAAASAEEALLGGEQADPSFNTQISFFPDGRSYVLTGNGAGGVYRIYEGRLAGGAPKLLGVQSKEDGHPAVSPDGRWLVYVSARGGIGKLILRDLTTGAERQITSGEKVDLYPAWSPDSASLAYVSGDNDNHDIFLIRGVTQPGAMPKPLTSWKYDDLRPIFSPDGSQIAFYSNYSPSGEEKEWSIVAVPADGSGPTKGAALARRAVALNVVTDPEVGAAWLPWGRAIVYARNLKAEWNPIYVVDVDTREEVRVETGTRMNHDLACSRKGELAFRAQVASWDDIFVAPLAGTP